MIDGGWWLVWGMAATAGLPLVAVGGVLRLCEAGWGRPAGGMRSGRLLAAGLVLCLPLAVYLMPALLSQLLRWAG